MALNLKYSFETFGSLKVTVKETDPKKLQKFVKRGENSFLTNHFELFRHSSKLGIGEKKNLKFLSVVNSSNKAGLKCNRNFSNIFELNIKL